MDSRDDVAVIGFILALSTGCYLFFFGLRMAYAPVCFLTAALFLAIDWLVPGVWQHIFLDLCYWALVAGFASVALRQLEWCRAAAGAASSNLPRASYGAVVVLYLAAVLAGHALHQPKGGSVPVSAVMRIGKQAVPAACCLLLAVLDFATAYRLGWLLWLQARDSDKRHLKLALRSLLLFHALVIAAFFDVFAKLLAQYVRGEPPEVTESFTCAMPLCAYALLSLPLLWLGVSLDAQQSADQQVPLVSAAEGEIEVILDNTFATQPQDRVKGNQVSAGNKVSPRNQVSPRGTLRPNLARASSLPVLTEVCHIHPAQNTTRHHKARGLCARVEGWEHALVASCLPDRLRVLRHQSVKGMAAYRQGLLAVRCCIYMLSLLAIWLALAIAAVPEPLVDPAALLFVGALIPAYLLLKFRCGGLLSHRPMRTSALGLSTACACYVLIVCGNFLTGGYGSVFHVSSWTYLALASHFSRRSWDYLSNSLYLATLAALVAMREVDFRFAATSWVLPADAGTVVWTSLAYNVPLFLGLRAAMRRDKIIEAIPCISWSQNGRSLTPSPKDTAPSSGRLSPLPPLATEKTPSQNCRPMTPSPKDTAPSRLSPLPPLATEKTPSQNCRPMTPSPKDTAPSSGRLSPLLPLATEKTPKPELSIKFSPTPSNQRSLGGTIEFESEANLPLGAVDEELTQFECETNLPLGAVDEELTHQVADAIRQADTRASEKPSEPPDKTTRDTPRGDSALDFPREYQRDCSREIGKDSPRSRNSRYSPSPQASLDSSKPPSNHSDSSQERKATRISSPPRFFFVHTAVYPAPRQSRSSTPRTSSLLKHLYSKSLGLMQVESPSDSTLELNSWSQCHSLLRSEEVEEGSVFGQEQSTSRPAPAGSVHSVMNELGIGGSMIELPDPPEKETPQRRGINVQQPMQNVGMGATLPPGVHASHIPTPAQLITATYVPMLEQVEQVGSAVPSSAAAYVQAIQAKVDYAEAMHSLGIGANTPLASGPAQPVNPPNSSAHFHLAPSWPARAQSAPPNGTTVQNHNITPVEKCPYT
eukprot:g62054.t1